MKVRTALALISSVAISFAAFADVDASKLPPASDKKDVTFEKDIKPLFDHSCVKCHGEVKPKGKLRLDSLAAVLKGGIDGKVVVPGNSAKSVIVHNIAHLGDEDQWMPPPKNKDNLKKLTDDQIGLVRAWIDQGAK
jgi:mono/diheme cytochrome c family protein